jgi:hypothetical protein
MSSASLDRPPSIADRIMPPANLGRHFLLFVDTEEEFDWSRPLRRDATATTAIAALPEAHMRLRNAGVRPVYLVDYPVVDDLRSADLMRAIIAQGGEVGAQLHPWVTPPHEEIVNNYNSFHGNLPIALERAKIMALTDRIEHTLGGRPRMFRAGRYGVGPNTAALLVEAGYRLDLSCRSLFDYRAGGGPDYIDHPVWPWRCGGLIAFPLTAAWTGRLRRHGGPLWRMIGASAPLRAIAARSGLLARVALTPEDMPVGAVLDAIRLLLDDGVSLFSLSFHSPSLVPGHTPYVRDAADLRAFWAWWDAVLGLFARAGVTGLGGVRLIGALGGDDLPEATTRLG